MGAIWGRHIVWERFGEDKLCVDKLCVDRLCEDKFRVDKLCVSDLVRACCV